MKPVALPVVMIATLVTSAGAFAQDTVVLEEITVTAQRREQSLQDVPVSVTALSGAQLAEYGINSTIELARVTPGLTIGQNSGDGDFPFISLRGVTLRDFADTNESPSAVYIDDFYKANLIGLDSQIFDMKRVEVLRGPQGTLYGRNATGGLIHYITNEPGPDYGGYANLTYGSYDQITAEAAVNAPVTDTLSIRVSALRDRHSGWVNNLFAAGSDGNGLNSTAVRGQILFKPSDDAEYSLLLQHSRNENDDGNMFTEFSARQSATTGLAVATPTLPGFGGYVTPAGADPRDTNSDRNIYLYTKQTTAIARGTWRIAGMELVSVSGYEKSAKDASFDSDATPLLRGTEVHPRGEQFSQEVRLSGEAERLHWTGGLYYIDYDVDGSQSRCQPATCNPLRRPVLYQLDTTSWAAFGNVDFDLTSALSLTGGLRYTADKKDYVLNNTDAGILFSAATVGALAKQDVGRVSFNGRLNWKASDDVLVYGGIARGFKAGTFNVGYTPIAFGAIPVRPEQLTSYEIGVKSSFLEKRLIVNASIFDYDYQDSQAYQFDGRTLASTAFNRDAAIRGAEAEIAFRPVAGLDLRVVATYLADAILKDVQRPGITGAGLPAIDTRMPLSPKWNLGALARYEWALPAAGSIALQGGANYLSNQYFDAFNSPAHYEPGYTTFNARASWKSESGHWNAAVFAENLADKTFRAYSFDLAFLNFGTSVYGKPRWVGGTIGYSW